MRAYKFLCKKYALENLQNKRLKQSRISELNDPFELVPYDLTNQIARKTFLKTRDDMDQKKGFLSFSAEWSNPVIWAHYSDNHRGLCLGFEIPELKGDPENDETDHITYQKELLPCPDFDTMSGTEYTSFVRKVLFTKFAHWEYEHEIRVWSSLEDNQSAINFVNFSESLKLVEVILGARCTLMKAEVENALGPLADGVQISKVRAAYDKFEMVKDEEWT
ncbi:MAG: DUF2971 domain-containing protein [Acidobacteria bacterium]|nr:DUF2971 domain-containing protein [Acidobacteriota bacterium]